MRHNIQLCSEIKFINSLHNSYKSYLNSCLHEGKMSKGLFFVKLNKSKDVRNEIILQISNKYNKV